MLGFELFSVHLHRHTRDSGPIRDHPGQLLDRVGFLSLFKLSWATCPGLFKSQFWHKLLALLSVWISVGLECFSISNNSPELSVSQGVFVKPPPAPNWNRSKGVLQVLSGQCPHCRLQAPNSNWMAAFLWAFIWELHQFWSSQDWKPVFMAVINWFARTEKETSMAGLVLLKSDRNNYGLSWLAAFKRWVLFSFQYQEKKKSHHFPQPKAPTSACSYH